MTGRCLKLGILIIAMVSGLFSVTALKTSAAFSVDAKEEFFEARIRPLLATHCYDCHTDAAKGGLRVDSREALLKGGNRGPAIVVGDPDASLLIKAVSHTDEKLKMPKGGTRLSDQEIANLSQW
ncbi:MAG TPA: c-type cytochrome domain-containing protein, partial [Blastocatellia bacterium]|nr:c-type cytochrome domain-containing protein [Blastocatellia bacterium]